MSNYLWFALALSPFVLGPLGFVLFVNGHTWAIGLVTFSGAALFGCLRLLSEFRWHGINNKHFCGRQSCCRGYTGSYR